ncbi:MAG TPA: helix-turn-helix domain-containing protein [Methanocorpusculum sp.]|nr:helix-turn-helix domain-containing protein [Methanocorpusculum sp.]HJK80752.1 helix-turn-helix domain-containing protein [Methanocorpusculum sp.]
MTPELPDRDVLAAYVDEGLSIRKIASRIGCSKTTVAQALRHHGLSRRRIRVPDEMKKKLRM